MLAGLLAGRDSTDLLQNANLIGAYVATQFGAVPADQLAASTPVVVTAANRSAQLKQASAPERAKRPRGGQKRPR
jgi:hypothetical protein